MTKLIRWGSLYLVLLSVSLGVLLYSAHGLNRDFAELNHRLQLFNSHLEDSAKAMDKLETEMKEINVWLDKSIEVQILENNVLDELRSALIEQRPFHEVE